MHSTANSTSLTPQWQELTLSQEPDPAQLENIKIYLDFVLLALEALAGTGPDAMLQTANHLNLESRVPYHMALWLPDHLNPILKDDEPKKLDVEEARAIVLISSTLAKQHQELIRRAVALLEQVALENRELQNVALLRDYLDRFSNIYQERRSNAENISCDLNQLSLKLLIDLLFCSSPNGHRRLWLALFDGSKKDLGLKFS